MNYKDLNRRHKSEIDFHDKKYSEKKKETIYDMGFTDLIFDDMLQKLGDIKGKKVVDYGCGNGWLTEILLQKGAEVWAFDISQEAVNLTLKVGEKLGLSGRLHADVMPAEKLSYKNNNFDIVVGVAILHHLDISLATREIHRVLKKGGTAYFMEPLAYNPLINFYRKRTPDIRSIGKPLRYEDFQLLSEIFLKFEHNEYYFFSLLSLFWYYVIENKKLLHLTKKILFEIDNIFLKCFPAMNKYCWYSILLLHK